MTLAATVPSALWLGTLPVTPNNRNQLKIHLDAVAAAVDSLIAGTAFTGSLTIGSAQTYPTSQLGITYPNLRSDLPAFVVDQYYYDAGEWYDPIQVYGYNWRDGGRADVSEPSVTLQFEADDISETDDHLLACGINFQSIAGINTRPIYSFYVKATGVCDTSYTSRFHIFEDQADHTLVHMTYGSAHTIGIGIACNNNANFHVLGRNLWQNNLGSVTADGKFWDWCYGGINGTGDSLALRAPTDSYGAAEAVFQVTRSGANVTDFTLYQPLKLPNIATYADNAAAVSGGLAVGTVYQTAAGALRVVVA